MDKKRHIERLFRRHYERMFLTASTLLRDKEEARDVVSEVFSRLLEQDSCLDGSQNTEAYLLVSVRNRCLNILAHRLVMKKNALHFSEGTAEDTPYEELPLDDILQYIQDDLPPQTGRIVRMRYAEGMPYREIERQTQLSRIAVYKHLRKGIEKLRKHFNPDSNG
ncbi:MAG: sigma-70 family RNA polymerase sigma factor [Prevotella sp.]|nr:sigma-70 family RNA polymerase sigma factor [Prevotella sp.]